MIRSRVITPTRVLVASFLLTLAVLAMLHPQRVEPARPFNVVTVPDNREAEMSDRLAALMTRFDCVPPAMWPAVRSATVPAFPVHTVVKPNQTFDLHVVAWDYPPKPYEGHPVWVMAVCAR